MQEKPKDQQQTEQRPKEPTVSLSQRRDFFNNLRKASKPQAPARPPAQSGMRGKGNRRPPPHHNTRSK